ncbi:MAG: hypothetical protein IJ192_02695 [Clostridia bacterium]|nr:hypothetical protein [Clostridia bacterium]
MQMNGVKLDSVEALKRNFTIDELIDSYFSGELEFFLRDIGETDKMHKVQNIPANNGYLLVRLYEIFDIDPKLTEQEVRASALVQ